MSRKCSNAIRTELLHQLVADVFSFVCFIYTLKQKPCVQEGNNQKTKNSKARHIKEYSLEKKENGFVLHTILTRPLLQYCLSCCPHFIDVDNLERFKM